MKAKLAALALALLAAVAGCAKSDWIERTLVTVDVTGTWCRLGDEGFCLELTQTGASAKGFIHYRGPAGPSPGGAAPVSRVPVDGQVTGDVFRFAQTNGAVRGEMTVSGDEMAGEMQFPLVSRVVLRRVDPSKIQDLAR